MFFRTRHCTRVHRLGVQKRAKLEKRVCFWSYIDKFGKEHDRQIKKNACKNAYLGSFFIPGKYVIRVLFVSPWTSLIPPLAIRVAPPGCTLNLRLFSVLIQDSNIPRNFPWTDLLHSLSTAPNLWNYSVSQN